MKPNERERDFYGDEVRIAVREDDCTIYRIKEETGEAVMSRYQVYKGIALVYNDVHIQEISLEKTNCYQNILEINHCREGRIEFESAKGEMLYLKKGDMAVSTKAGVKEFSYFPQCHYHGVTIELDLDVLQKGTDRILEEFGLDLSQMKENFCRDNRCFVLQGKEEFEHLFAELYRVPEKIRSRYYKVKVIEILLFLSAIDVKQEHMENRYFNKELAATVKEIHGYMITHLEKKVTIDFLAAKFQISPTRLKQCFREVYGDSVYAYLKKYRIHKAAEWLRNSSLEIGTIAGMVSYDNASKFSKSFRSIMGINPKEYRKSV